MIATIVSRFADDRNDRSDRMETRLKQNLRDGFARFFLLVSCFTRLFESTKNIKRAKEQVLAERQRMFNISIRKIEQILCRAANLSFRPFYSQYRIRFESSLGVCIAYTRTILSNRVINMRNANEHVGRNTPSSRISKLVMKNGE